jgi:hypothetical protein
MNSSNPTASIVLHLLLRLKCNPVLTDYEFIRFYSGFYFFISNKQLTILGGQNFEYGLKTKKKLALKLKKYPKYDRKTIRYCMKRKTIRYCIKR